ncbi:MAG TPA: hypothetical protein VFM06_04725 [Candidatus Limnocylindria bacterium]|nr:hypothetical protein [Candidatus Limnocylindria bacterium]
MSDERGQALVVAVLFLAVAAVAIVGLRAAQDRIASVAGHRRAGEAAVEAATAVIADAYVEELRRALLSEPPATPDVAGAVGDGRALESARAAASELSLRNGGTVVSSIGVRCADGAVTVSLVLSGASYRAGFAASECSPR